MYIYIYIYIIICQAVRYNGGVQFSIYSSELLIVPCFCEAATLYSHRLQLPW